MGKLLLLVVLMLSSACGGRKHTIPGTDVRDTTFNRGIMAAVERYRVAVEEADIATLLLLASKDYWEDGGTTSGSDDYGYEKLREVLTARFHKAKEIRYALRYLDVKRECRSGALDSKGNSIGELCRAYVDVLIDASFTVLDARDQEKRLDMRDQNQLVLQYEPDTEKWMFVSGY